MALNGNESLECVMTFMRQCDKCAERPVVYVFYEGGGRRWIRTIEGVSRQIYSLPSLAT